VTTVRRAALAGVALFGGALALYATGDSRMTGAATPRTLDPDVVVVVPFTVRDSQMALLDLRDAIQDLIVAALPGRDGGPRAVSSTLGAGQLLRGEVSGTPNDLSIDAALLGVPDRAVRARVRVRGNADSLPHLTEKLTAHLLARQAARDSVELAAMMATSPAALRAYLAARHAYRRGRAGTSSDAKEHLQRAVFLDSTFALAGLRLAEIAAMYGMAGRDERWQFDAVWRQRNRLGVADRALLEAYVGPGYPRRSTLSELITAGERAAEVAPHRAEAWHIAGVYLFWLGQMIGYPAWQSRADDALRRALAFDSTAALTLDFLMRLTAQARDREAIRRYARLYLTNNPAAYNADFVRWLAAVMLEDDAALAAARRRLVTMTHFNLRAIVDQSVALGISLEDADTAARLYADSLSRATARITAIVPFLLNRGRPDGARRLLATAHDGFGQNADVGLLEFRIYAALFWDGDSSEAMTAAQSIEAYLDGTPAPRGHVWDRQTASCALAHWRLAIGDLAGAEAALARIRPLSRAAESYPIESTPVCAAALEAELAAAHGRPNAHAALVRLDTLLRAGSSLRWLVPIVGNVIAARLYEERGDPQYALAIIRRRTSWVNQLLSTQLREEGRLAALLGDYAGAVRAYRHYLALRSDPEPKLRRDVERVRAELQRLELGRRE
jgi:tetratricopeptide (TPR) repeat protein